MFGTFLKSKADTVVVEADSSTTARIEVLAAAVYDESASHIVGDLGFVADPSYLILYQ